MKKNPHLKAEGDINLFATHTKDPGPTHHRLSQKQDNEIQAVNLELVKMCSWENT